VLNTGNAWASSVGEFGNTLGIGNGNPAGIPGLMSLTFTNTDVNSIGTSEETQSFDDHVWQFEDGLSWSHGRHNFKFGGQLNYETLKTSTPVTTVNLVSWTTMGRLPVRLLEVVVVTVAPILSSASTINSVADKYRGYLAAIQRRYRGLCGRHVAPHGQLNLESRSAVRCAHPLGGSQRPASELQLRYRNIDLAGKNGAVARSTTASMEAGTSSPASGSRGLQRYWRTHGIPRRLHNFFVYGRYGHKPSSATQSTLRSGRNQFGL